MIGTDDAHIEPAQSVRSFDSGTITVALEITPVFPMSANSTRASGENELVSHNEGILLHTFYIQFKNRSIRHTENSRLLHFIDFEGIFPEGDFDSNPVDSNATVSSSDTAVQVDAELHQAEPFGLQQPVMDVDEKILHNKHL